MTVTDTAHPFVTLGRSDDLDNETTYVIEKLIDRVGSKLKNNDGYWEKQYALTEAQRKSDYIASFDVNRLEEALCLLQKSDHLSLQCVNAVKKVSTIEPIRYFSWLTSLNLTENKVTDISPAETLPELTKLSLYMNELTSIVPLKVCQKLQTLNLSHNPIQDLSVLEKLPQLKELQISRDQLVAFSRLEKLPELQELKVVGRSDDNLIPQIKYYDLPSMPELRFLRLCNCSSLEGVDKSPLLQNASFEGLFTDLSPLRSLVGLTHLVLSSEGALDISPLANIETLRVLTLCIAEVIGYKGILGLPNLHEIRCEPYCLCPDDFTKSIKSLSSWDNEFAVKDYRFAESEFFVVDQETFDYYDVNPYGLECWDGNEAMLESEQQWLVERMNTFLKNKFEEDEDYIIPWNWCGARSFTLCIYSRKAYTSFNHIVKGVQLILSSCKHDWIIYFQSEIDESNNKFLGDFEVWVYKDKVLIPKQHEEKISQLKSPRKWWKIF